MKKIKITEEQAKRLKLIDEGIDPLTQFEEFAKARVNEINLLYGKVINLTTAEVINHEIDMTEIWKHLSNIGTALHAKNKIAYNFIVNSPESDELDARIDIAYDSVSNKLTALELIVTNLETLQDEAEEHKLSSVFQDVKPMEITPFGE